MNPVTYLRTMRTSAKVLLGALALGALLVALFDWNWLRAPLVRHLVEESGREVRIDDLDVELGLSPTVTVRGLYVANASWAASERPFANAGRASFTFPLRSLWERRLVVSRIVLSDAQIEMERLADGRSNWRLKPDDAATGHLTVQALEAHRTRIRFVNRRRDLEFTVSATAVEARDDLTTRLTFEGRYQGAEFSGEAFNGGVVSFRGSGFTFPLRGYLVSRNARLDLDGRFSDIFEGGPFDTRVHVTGPSLSLLHPFLPIHPPQSRRFDLTADLARENGVYRFSKLHGKVGSTDVEGEAMLDRSSEPAAARVHLQSQSAHSDDLRSLLSVTPSEARPKASKATAQSRSAPRELDVERLRAFDVALSFDARKLTVPEFAAVESLRLQAALKGGTLQVKPLEVGLAAGRALGSLSFEGHGETPRASVDLELKGLRLDRLIPKLASTAALTSTLAGRIKLESRADSVAGLIERAQGSVVARLSGGQLSNVADAKLALNLGKLIALKLRGDRSIALNCGIAEFDVREGRASSRSIVLDTEDTQVEGVGSVDLRSGAWNVVLTPHPRRPGLLTRHASIRVEGNGFRARTFIQKAVELRRKNQTTRSDPCTGTVTVAPEQRVAR